MIFFFINDKQKPEYAIVSSFDILIYLFFSIFLLQITTRIVIIRYQNSFWKMWHQINIQMVSLRFLYILFVNEQVPRNEYKQFNWKIKSAKNTITRKREEFFFLSSLLIQSILCFTIKSQLKRRNSVLNEKCFSNFMLHFYSWSFNGTKLINV